MKNLKINLLSLSSFLLLLLTISCTDELNTKPEGAEQTADEVFSDPDSYKNFLAKLYAGLATTGQQGPAGAGDVAGIDEGFSSYLRNYWNFQELTTDEAIIAWNDATIKDFHWHSWTTSDGFIKATFYRLAYQITNCNEFLRQSTDEKLDSRGITGAVRDEIIVYRAEARFLRALSYWHIIDLFGGASLTTEDSPTQYYLPPYASRQDLFDFVEQELTEMESDLKDPNTNEQFRVDKAAAWMLKAKLFLNAQVYIGEDRNADAFTYVNKVINETSYSLHNNYRQLFMADNNSNGAQNEFIFAVAFDGLHTKTYGGTTYLTHAAVGGSMTASDFGINGGWAGLRTTSAFVNKFNGMDNDYRKQFYTNGQSLEINDVGSFTDGYAISKWKNVDSFGNQGSDSSGDFVDTDYPVFRLADAYLMYAECYLRNGGGDASTAVGYINDLRERAYGNTSGNITTSDLNLDFILDERARELHWEGHRRTDLIRFGKFSGSSYLWPWKGNVANGSPIPTYRRLFPIPQDAIIVNPNLIQNPGY
ncbi:RagB/SusD family nutrient uptake outer membrane protein [Flavobacterium haoranii]|uniref:Starch-binding associating with outer membrane n=1 Tax=Flavobacterium haoranii TaxID=683124 RepID=A0A1M6CY28_9FLAO|nr:RagB/SusD family nutrient uptake outer membrane protein [Flavobacterium haoranii]SHI65896.1 Starch-binding associating with outer membrane [Flavobacterium haoranii]